MHNGNGSGGRPLNYMAAFALRLIDNGYSIIPIEPGTKRPGTWSSAHGWQPMADWTRFCIRPTSSIEANLFIAYPDAGIGGCGGPVAMIDLDVIDPDIAAQLQALAFEMFGPTPLIRIGLAPKRMLVYRAKEAFAGIRRHPVEILCRGQQGVWFATHPETGKPYFWIDDSPADVHIMQLPAITEADARRFIDDAYALIPDTLKPASLMHGDNDPHLPSGRQRGTLEAIKSALETLPNNDWDYDIWRNIGMATWAAVGLDGLPLFLAWSAKSKKHNLTQDSEKFFRGLKNIHSVGAGTVYHWARKFGWICPPEITMDPAAKWEPGSHPAQALLNNSPSLMNPVSAVVDNIFVPEEIRNLNPDSFLGLFVEHCLASAVHPQPILALAAALCCCAVLAGRRYRSPTNLRSNIYVVAIGESGSGKEHGRSVINETLAQSGLLRLLGGNKLVSGGGLLSALHRSPASLFQLDEFGHFLSLVTDRRASKYLAEIWHHLTELFTKAASTYAGSEYTDQIDRPRRDICQPCAVVHATTTPGLFWAALNAGALEDGSLARWLPFISDDPVPERNKHPRDITAIPETLIMASQAIVRGADGWSASLGEGPSVNPQPYIVTVSGEADHLLDTLGDMLVHRRRLAVGNGHGPILARWWEYVVRLAMIHAISENSMQPVIEAPNVEWAKAIVGWCMEMLMTDATRYVSANENEAELKRILTIIRRCGAEGITLAQLTRQTQFVMGRKRNEILSDLLVAEQIVREERDTGKRPATVFRVI